MSPSASVSPRWILGSSSPRRVELLELLRRPFTIVKPRTVERQQAGELPEAYVIRNSHEKIVDVLAQLPATDSVLAICADTIVVVDGDVLEKPQDTTNAVAMLTRLSGREHLVLTGLVVSQRLDGGERTEAQVVSTTVRFKKLSQTEILHYVNSGEPMDKAGAYGAQGLGACFVQAIQGSYTNVVGLPMAELTNMLTTNFGCYP